MMTHLSTVCSSNGMSVQYQEQGQQGLSKQLAEN